MSNDTEAGLAVPHARAGDYAHTIARAALSAVPLIGGPAVEFFAAVFRPPMQKRQDVWMEQVAEGLRKLLYEKRLTTEDVINNEVFIDAAMKASYTAIRTSEAEKLAALKNAVLNSALPEAPDASKQGMFIGWVDLFTVLHLRILTLFSDPERWYRSHGLTAPGATMASPMAVLERAFPELMPEKDLYQQVWRDLYQRGLVSISDLNTTMTKEGAMLSRATRLGSDFIRFITER